MEAQEFAGFLSGVASRLRHDLKGGLISLRMGLEALPEEEALKPLLLERARSLETLSDKLVLLLRMGQMRPEPVRLSALLGEFRARLANTHPRLRLELPTALGEARPRVDSDALLYGLLELAENAALAGASRLKVEARLEARQVELSLRDDGGGPAPDDARDPLASLSPLGVSRWGRSGLGLAIAECCARGHGGELRLRAAEGGGMQAVLVLREPS
jgi:two-component system osmolarity sensor histidine kinase EnvZ